jgi:hypothetical protein
VGCELIYGGRCAPSAAATALDGAQGANGSPSRAVAIGLDRAPPLPAVFQTITEADWRAMFRRERAAVNAVVVQIRREEHARCLR